MVFSDAKVNIQSNKVFAKPIYYVNYMEQRGIQYLKFQNCLFILTVVTMICLFCTLRLLSSGSNYY